MYVSLKASYKQMKKTIFEISHMDCPSEENLIRMKLDGIEGISRLDFDIPTRKLTVFHTSDVAPIEQSVMELKLGGKRLSTEVTAMPDEEEQVHSNQRKLLWWVLLINFSFFLLEIITGLVSKSMGLIADSLDMLADASVYGMSLLAVGGTLMRKKRIARIAGYLQLSLALVGFAEVVRRFAGIEQLPDYSMMIYVSVLALLANSFCLYLLNKSKNKEEAHMQASMIFTSNDVIINLGVIAAALLVNWLHSGVPDLIVGLLVFGMVIRGALRILKLAR